MSQLLYPTTVNAVSKQLNANYTNADVVITLTNTTSIQNKPGMCLINRVDTNGSIQPTANWTYIEFTATSGATLTGCTVLAGGQDQALGKVVEFVSDVTQQQRILDTLVVGHNDDGTHKASLAFTTPTLTSPVLNTGVSGTAVKDEDDMASNSATALATQQSIKAYVDTKIASDGWSAAGETWTYASADDPTFTFTIAGDVTTKYRAGMRIKLTQTTAKYFIISKDSTYSAPNTTVTVYGGTDYDLANAVITLPYYSTAKAPAGFPLDPSKWAASLADSTDRSQASPTASAWYNLGSLSISIPLGIWDVDYSVCAQLDKTGVNAVFCTLSTANNSESDAGFTTNVQPAGAFGGGSMGKRKTLVLAAKTAYYINSMTTATGATTMYNRNSSASGSNLAIIARCAYL